MERVLHKIIVAITGFGQSLAEQTDLESLMLDAWERSDLTTTFLRFRWNDDLAAIRAFIGRIRKRWANVEIVIVGYSYGGGSAVRLCRLLKAINVSVAKLFLCDAVWRPFRYSPSLFSLWGGPLSLVVPSNVWSLYSWRQSITWIRGSRITLQNDILTDWRINRENVPAIHSEMDQIAEFRESVLAAVA